MEVAGRYTSQTNKAIKRRRKPFDGSPALDAKSEVSILSKNSKSLAMRALSTICIMQIIWVGIGWNTLSLYAAPITEEWGITRAAFMLSITLVATCNTFISMFLYGRLVEKLGMRKLIIVGGALCTAGFVCFATAQNIIMLYITGILFGSGCALLNNNAVAAVCQVWYKKNTGTYMSTAATFGSVAGIIAATAVAALIVGVGWRTSLWVIAIISVVGMIVLAAMYPGSPKELGVVPVGADETSENDADAAADEAEDGPSYSEMLKTGKFYLLAFEMLVIGVVGYGILANLAPLVGDYGYADLSGTALSVALLASAVFLIPSGRIMDKFGSAIMIATCFVFLIIAMLIMLFGVV